MKSKQGNIIIYTMSTNIFPLYGKYFYVNQHIETKRKKTHWDGDVYQKEFTMILFRKNFRFDLTLEILHPNFPILPYSSSRYI